MISRRNHYSCTWRYYCVGLLVFILICISISCGLPSSAKTQNSTEWRRKIGYSTEPNTFQRRKPHQHKTHGGKGDIQENSRRFKENNRTITNTSFPTSVSVDGLSPWSSWSKCTKECRQFRERHCRNGKRCHNSLLRQERACRKGRCKRKAFHVVLPPKRESFKHPSQSDVRVLLSLNSIFYSSWSRWTPCTKLCTTTRYRSCRFPVVCGNTVLHEEAYCYTIGTDCEKWYSHRANYKDISLSEDQEYKDTLPAVKGDIFSLPEEDHDDANEIQECGLSGANPSYNIQLRIIGGRQAARGRWPWQVAILNRFKEAFCGGTLVGRRWVLTAAHCLRKRLYVRIGEYDLVEDDGTEIDYRVEDVFVHPDYDPETVDNDVALLRLPEPVKIGQGVRLACLPQPRQSLPITQKCTIIGWGKETSSHVSGTEVLHEAEVPIVNTTVCRKVYQDYFITENMFCAGYRKGRIDSCAGDSGGPLLCRVSDRWTIFGITSFGEGCGKEGKYGIYTKVPNYVSWIQRIIELNSRTRTMHA